MEVDETTTDQPRPLTIGLIGSDRYLFAAVEAEDLVMGVGAPESWNVLFRYLDGESPTPPEASLAHATQRRAAAAQEAPLTLYLLAPLGLPTDASVGQVLAGQQQLAATLTSVDPAQVEVWVALSGEFPDTIEDNLRALFRAVAAEPLGAALGLAAGLNSLRVEAVEGVVTIRVSLPTDRVVLGLETLFGVELWKLMEGRSSR
jgi:hypothetical protein